MFDFICLYLKYIHEINLKIKLGKGYCVVISDANFRRYGIRASQLNQLIVNASDKKVDLHFVFIADLNGEADDVVDQMLRNGHVCRETDQLPDTLRQILLKSIKE